MARGATPGCHHLDVTAAPWVEGRSYLRPGRICGSVPNTNPGSEARTPGLEKRRRRPMGRVWQQASPASLAGRPLAVDAREKIKFGAAEEQQQQQQQQQQQRGGRRDDDSGAPQPGRPWGLTWPERGRVTWCPPQPGQSLWFPVLCLVISPIAEQSYWNHRCSSRSSGVFSMTPSGHPQKVAFAAISHLAWEWRPPPWLIKAGRS
ncbi:hypothetical protein BO71DRAFT_198329 [Aspergillus ellipticus CBS 707.79]|uniref:Uncharacterized protein n=1 Tax=Aspergillus ellipticus CBS 707.79 TaxID=1448320 RepID=A0A319DEH3_9EURO|nr:hypothetical protein BO71DRAFT_198329 [Aspergillus ellipticus CBS 707.79]